MNGKLNNESVMLNAEIIEYDDIVLVKLFPFPSCVFLSTQISLFKLADSLYDTLEQKKTVFLKVAKNPGELLSFYILTTDKLITCYEEDWTYDWSQILDRSKKMILPKWVHYVLAHRLLDILSECILDTHAHTYHVIEEEKEEESEETRTRYTIRYRFVKNGIWKEHEEEGYVIPLTAKDLIWSDMNKWLKQKLISFLKTLRPEEVAVLFKNDEWCGRKRATWFLIHKESGTELYSHSYTVIGPGSRSFANQIALENEALQLYTKKTWAPIEVTVSSDLLKRLVKTALKSMKQGKEKKL